MRPKDFCKRWGHNTYTVLDNEEIVIERCKECKTRLDYNKVGGKVDNKRYLADHYRDYIQYGTKDYARFYDEAGRKKREKEDAQLTKDMINENNEKMEKIKAQRERETFSTGKKWF